MCFLPPALPLNSDCAFAQGRFVFIDGFSRPYADWSEETRSRFEPGQGCDTKAGRVPGHKETCEGQPPTFSIDTQAPMRESVVRFLVRLHASSSICIALMASFPVAVAGLTQTEYDNAVKARRSSYELSAINLSMVRYNLPTGYPCLRVCALATRRSCLSHEICNTTFA